ncbi:MAG: deiodinase family protein [Gemmataceae bacterium]
MSRPSTCACLVPLAVCVLVLAGAAPGQERRPAKHPLAGIDPKALEDPAVAEKTAAMLEEKYKGRRAPEAVRMLIDIVHDKIGGNYGWFGPAESRYTWVWLAKRCGVDPDKGGIARDRFSGPDEIFARLDRNRDGVIRPADLDWSEKNPDVQMAAMVNRIYRFLNAGGNGRLTREEMLRFFEKAAAGKDHVTPDAFRETLLAGFSGGFLPGDAPTREVLIRGLFNGELGSVYEGPRLNDPAPNFTLKTADGKESIELASLIGKKPVVLALGNFTCSPYRATYAEVDGLHARYKKDANFLMVYVREAHPTDGWKMEVNERVGVSVKQPTTLAERAVVAGRFCSRLKPNMPVVVDDVDDNVGHAYSGMPGRFYVIDTAGKVAYKSGRGPFGFRVGELEQALVMALVEQTKK